MFVDFISQFLGVLVNEQVADIFAVPMAVFICFMLLFVLFTMFTNSSIKKIILILICVIVGVFTIYCIADIYGFITLPVTLGG